MKYPILFFSTIIICIFTAGLIFNNYYTPCKTKKPYRLSTANKDTIQIVFIGDSWAFFHKPHDSEASEMLSDMLQQPVNFQSFGVCGLTSKEMYEQLFYNDSLKHFLYKGSHYCVLSAGINDTYKKMSTDYYAKSMEAILQFFLYNNVIPLIIEIPDYDIEKCYHRQTATRKLLRQLSMFVNNIPIDCKQMFRETLDSIFSDYKGKAILLHYQTWNSHYTEDLQHLYKEDGLHLNAVGYSILDQQIGVCLLRQINYFNSKNNKNECDKEKKGNVFPYLK